MIIGCDLDGMLVEFPEFFQEFFKDFQKGDNKIGIITYRPSEEREGILEYLTRLGIKPDFYIDRAGVVGDTPPGVFKATVCNELGVDLLFDDFQSDDPNMLGDFFTHNVKTVPFTSWAYSP